MISIAELLKTNAAAHASIKGNTEYPHICGTAKFYAWAGGTILALELINMPIRDEPFAVHVHTGHDCTPDDFSHAGGHYNPDNKEHPSHAGDLPSVFSENGYVYMVYFTIRFKPQEILGRSVIIHEHHDDYVTDPSGNSGKRIACGSIVLNIAN